MGVEVIEQVIQRQGYMVIYCIISDVNDSGYYITPYLLNEELHYFQNLICRIRQFYAQNDLIIT